MATVNGTSNVLQAFRSIKPDQRPEDIIAFLRELLNKLREIDSGDSRKFVSKKLAEHLANGAFLGHGDSHVRASVAACLAEMFRIFVGTEDDEMGSQDIPAQLGPLSNVELLQEVLEFFVDQLHHFLNRQSPHYVLGFHVASTMATTKAFTLIFNVDDNQKLVEELVEMFFAVISDKHTAADRLVFLDILIQVIGDADVIISPKLLNILLHPLTREGQRNNQSAYGLAKDLLRRIPKNVEPCISSYFINQLVFETSENEETRHSVLEILLELFNVSPQLVGSALKHLDIQIGSNVLKDRLECLVLLGEIFSSNKFPETATADKELLVNFGIQRLTDSEERVRIQAVKSGKMFVCTRKGDEDESRLKHYVACIGERFMDPAAGVRAEAIRAMTSICECAFDFLPSKIMEKLGDRLLDKDHHVREVSVNCVCELFYRLLYDAAFVPSGTERTRTETGPLLKRFLDSIMLMPECTSVEFKFMTKLMPATTNEQTLANHLVYFYSCGGPDGRRFFEETLTKNMLIRKLFLDALSEDAFKAKHQKEYLKKILSLSPEIDTHRAGFEELIKRLMDDHNFRAQAKILASGDIQNYGNALEELLKHCGNPTGTNHLHAATKRLFELVVPFRLTSKFCRIVYATVVDVLSDHISGAEFLCHSAIPVQPEVLRQRSSRLLQILAFHMPKAFCVSVHLDRIMKFWRDRDSEVALNVYRFFSYCGRKMKSEHQNKRAVETLVEKSKDFASKERDECTPPEAKYSVRILNGISSDRLTVFRQLLGWSKELILSQDYDDIRRAAAVAAVGEISACTAYAVEGPVFDKNDSFVEPDEEPKELEAFAKEVIGIVESFLIPQLNFQNMITEKEVEDGWTEKEDLPISVQFFLEDIKAIGKCLRAYRTLVLGKATFFLPVLRMYVNKLKDCLTDPAKNLKKMSDVSREHVMLCSAIQLVKTLPKFTALEPAKDLALLFLVLPKLSSTESQEKYLRCLFRSATEEPEVPGRIIAAISSGALCEFNDATQYRNIVLAPLVNCLKRLRKYVIINADKYAARLPERGLLYLLHTLALSKEFKDSENIHDSVPWLEKVGPAIYCLLDAYITENQQFSPGIINVLLRASKSAHISGLGKNRKLDQKMYTLCDFTSVLLEKRFPQGVKQFNPAELTLPSDILESKRDATAPAKDAEISPSYFTDPVTVMKKSDGRVIISIGHHGRSMSRDSEVTKTGRARSKRSRSSNMEPEEITLDEDIEE